MPLKVQEEGVGIGVGIGVGSSVGGGSKKVWILTIPTFDLLL